MPWENTPAKRAQDAKTYGDPLYRKNRELARARAGGRCEQCGHPHLKLECDHIVPKSTGVVNNSLANLQMLCTREGGGCGCHEAKTYEQRSNSPRRAADPEPTPDVWW